MAEVISSIAYPRVKKVRPVPSYRGVLTIGHGEDAVGIDVERYPRTKKCSAPSASKYVDSKDVNGAANADIQGGHVALQRTYKINKGEKEEMEVERRELDKAYHYGSTIVPISDSDQDVIKLETEAELSIIGFVEEAGVRVLSAVLIPV
jgi:ATP-dependent DNA helicase 2 subunit 2